MSAPLVAASLTLMVFVAAGCDSSKKRAACGGTFTNAAQEALASQSLEAVCKWGLSRRLLPGARIFVTSGCTTCHTYRHVGARNLGAPDLTSVGKRHGRRFFERYVPRPADYGDDVMPPFAALGERRLAQLALFLAASKGTS